VRGRTNQPNVVARNGQLALERDAVTGIRHDDNRIRGVATEAGRKPERSAVCNAVRANQKRFSDTQSVIKLAHVST
jgi:glycine/D-amino acid oxidase-like deaminating enzyme